ncbi:MAG TPA: Maf family nucleotide pyrophosphatase [Burkholderiales bacterium]
MKTETSRRLVLASGSPYRRELLARLQLPFEVAVPEVDEAPLRGEAPVATAERLARVKAQAVAARFPDALVIGSDQVADLDGEALGKPGDRDNARRQLSRMSGRTTVFHTALALLDAPSGRLRSRVVPCAVTLRPLAPEAIERYLDLEQPYNCAGSAKAEGLGIALIAKLEGEDPNALIGLPLIALVEMLAAEGLPVV